MKHLKIFGFAVLLSAAMVFSGCGNNNHNDEVEKITDLPVKPTYTIFPLEAAAHALTNDGKNLVYGTIFGSMYSLNLQTGESTFMYDLNVFVPEILIGGLAYIEGSKYYYSAAHASTINRLDISTGTSEVIATKIFPDGIDFFHNKVYSVTMDRSEVLAVYDPNGVKLGTLSTGIDDMVAIAHSNKFLYILSEDGDVYQTDPDTGTSRLIIDNGGGEFEEGDSFGGVEGIDVLNNYIYMSNVGDDSVYRIDIDVRAFE